MTKTERMKGAQGQHKNLVPEILILSTGIHHFPKMCPPGIQNRNPSESADPKIFFRMYFTLESKMAENLMVLP